ncbi:MAG TPA: helix-turn-helix transcriptional regulator [Rhodocyclaceae bacterium]|nr:helix-turn-helix transcriptional regulator [Rhodocyclaceae bacterium]
MNLTAPSRSQLRVADRSPWDRPDSLLLDLYACPTTPNRWPRVLDQICAETGAVSAVIQSFDLEGARLRERWSVQDSHTQRFIATRAQPISGEDNPRLDLKRGLLGLDRLVRDEDLFGHDERSLHELRRQLATLGLGCFLGTLWQVDRNSYVSLALHRPADEGDFSRTGIDRLANMAPHIHQAASLTRRLESATEIGARLRRHFDRLRSGMVICNCDGEVQWTNRSAERMLSVGDSALRLHAGSLLGRNPPITEALLREITTVAAGSDGRYLALGHGSRVMHLALQPLDDAEAQMHGCGSVLLILTTPDMGTPVSSDALVRLFGLTPAESRLVSALVDGHTLEDYATLRKVSIGTVRGQLKQVLAKTATARQSELVRLVLSSAAAQVTTTG